MGKAKMKQERISRWVRRAAASMGTVGLLAALGAQPQAALGRGRTAGATVVVTTGGAAVKGELIGVREDAIVLMSERGDNTILVSEIDNVRIVKRAPIVGLGLLGLVVGGAVGLLAAPHIHNEDPLGEGIINLVKDFAYASIGCIIGIGAGVGTALAIGKDKVIVFKGKTKEENTTALNGLRKEARVADYR